MVRIAFHNEVLRLRSLRTKRYISTNVECLLAKAFMLNKVYKIKSIKNCIEWSYNIRKLGVLKITNRLRERFPIRGTDQIKSAVGRLVNKRAILLLINIQAEKILQNEQRLDTYDWIQFHTTTIRPRPERSEEEDQYGI